MVTRTQKYSNRFPKRENVINLIDTGRNNITPVTKVKAAIDSGNNSTNYDVLPIFITGEDKGQSVHPEPYTPPEIEPQEEERLENLGATVLDSTTYYPASKISISKRSQTPQERAEERGYSLDR